MTEAGLPPDAGAGGKGYLTVERMLEEVRMGGLGGGVGGEREGKEGEGGGLGGGWGRVGMERFFFFEIFFWIFGGGVFLRGDGVVLCDVG